MCSNQQKVTVADASKDDDHIRDFAADGNYQEVKTLSKKEWDAISKQFVFFLFEWYLHVLYPNFVALFLKSLE